MEWAAASGVLPGTVLVSTRSIGIGKAQGYMWVGVLSSCCDSMTFDQCK